VNGTGVGKFCENRTVGRYISETMRRSVLVTSSLFLDVWFTAVRRSDTVSFNSTVSTQCTGITEREFRTQVKHVIVTQ